MSADEEQRSPEEIQAEIEEVRSDLGETVAAAADKADVKKQAKKKVDETKEKVNAVKDQAAEMAGDLKDRAGEKIDEVKDSDSPAAELLPDSPPRIEQAHLIAGGAALAGFILGRWTARR